VLHFATHGVVNNASPLYSYLVLAKDNLPNGEDGLLEAWELMQLDLQADLAVLSACETGPGRIRPGEGVIGLSWALFVAGVPTTVVSQWKVESSSTAQLMHTFYQDWKAGQSPARAMQSAARQLLYNDRYSHPFSWAPFIAIGNAQ
jgi:CHAT domain-containing protein